MIDWSYHLLTEPERELFDRLSVFAGGFGLAAAEAIAGPGDDVIELLGQLVDKSLLLRAGGVGGLSRYRLLDTLRQYGRDRLVRRGAAEEVRRRHAAYYAELAGQLNPTLPPPATNRFKQLIFSLRRTPCAARIERRSLAASVITTTTTTTTTGGGWLRYEQSLTNRILRLRGGPGRR